MPGRITPPRYSPARRDDVERRRGAEVDAHRGAVVAVAQRDAVDQAVGADLARVVVADRQPGPHAGPDGEHLVAEVAARPSRATRARAAGPCSRRSTPSRSSKPRPRSASRLRSAAPSSSAVDVRTVAKRQCSTSSVPSNVPKCVWVLPTSTTRSTAARILREHPRRAEPEVGVARRARCGARRRAASAANGLRRPGRRRRRAPGAMCSGAGARGTRAGRRRRSCRSRRARPGSGSVRGGAGHAASSSGVPSSWVSGDAAARASRTSRGPSARPTSAARPRATPGCRRRRARPTQPTLPGDPRERREDEQLAVVQRRRRPRSGRAGSRRRSARARPATTSTSSGTCARATSSGTSAGHDDGRTGDPPRRGRIGSAREASGVRDPCVAAMRVHRSSSAAQGRRVRRHRAAERPAHPAPARALPRADGARDEARRREGRRVAAITRRIDEQWPDPPLYDRPGIEEAERVGDEELQPVGRRSSRGRRPTARRRAELTSRDSGSRCRSADRRARAGRHAAGRPAQRREARRPCGRTSPRCPASFERIERLIDDGVARRRGRRTRPTCRSPRCSGCCSRSSDVAPIIERHAGRRALAAAGSRRPGPRAAGVMPAAWLPHRGHRSTRSTRRRARGQRVSGTSCAPLSTSSTYQCAWL